MANRGQAERRRSTKTPSVAGHGGHGHNDHGPGGHGHDDLSHHGHPPHKSLPQPNYGPQYEEQLRGARLIAQTFKEIAEMFEAAGLTPAASRIQAALLLDLKIDDGDVAKR